MALSGWSNRLKLTIDGSKIDEDVEDFPVLVVLSSSTGQEFFDATIIFDELTISGSSYTNRKKIAITTSDKETQCYVEVERWDHDNEQAWLHVKVPTVTSGTDTKLYLYYDSTQSDNTTYVGDVGSTPGQAVWDSNFVSVWHMSQDPTGGTGCIKDSTSNSNHGTPGGLMLTEDLVDGQIGKALDFDGNDDYVGVSDSSTFKPSAITISAWIKKDVNGSVIGVWQTEASATAPRYIFNSKPAITIRNSTNTANSSVDNTVSGTQEGWHQLGVTSDGTLDETYMFYDGFDKTGTKNDNGDGWNPNTSGYLYIGKQQPNYGEIDATVDDVRISNVTRSSSWMKANYYSDCDNLITYSPSYYFSGYTFEEEDPVSRTLYLHNRTDGGLMDTTTSSGNGYYYLGTTSSGAHYIVCLDDESGEDYNDMILGNMFPIEVT